MEQPQPIREHGPYLTLALIVCYFIQFALIVVFLAVETFFFVLVEFLWPASGQNNALLFLYVPLAFP